MQLPNLPSRVCKLTVSFKDFNVSHLHKGQTIILNVIHNLINYNTTLKLNFLKSCLSCHLRWCLPCNCLIFIHERTLKNKLSVLLSDFVLADVTSQWAIIANKVYGFASVGYDYQLCVIISSK